MNTPVIDDRTFENAVTLTPEEVASNAKHFEEKGYEIEVQPEEGADPTVEAPKEEVVAVPPVDNAAPDDPSIDAESRADFESAKTDGEKLGHYAKRTKKINELKTTVSEKDAEIERLRTELAARAAVVPAAPSLAPPVSATPEPAKVEPINEIKPAVFDKPKPTKPKLEDFADQDDPHAAFTAAGIDHLEEVQDWKEEKHRFENADADRVRTEQQQRDQQANLERDRVQRINQKFEDAKVKYPDFVTRTAPVKFSSVMRWALSDELPDGYDLGYELSKPEHAATLKAILDKTPESTDQRTILSMMNQTLADLAVFRYTLQHPPASATATPAAVAPAPPAAAAPPAKPAPVQTPPATPLREEASPTTVRGRASAGQRLEDIDPMDTDARRAFKKANGLM